MLAYVFWHWPQPGQAPAAYEDLQRTFHGALRQAAPSGFVGSATFRVEGQAAWLAGRPAYVDWYLATDSAALDPLNVAAVSGVCQEPHARVAQAIGAGVGSLLALQRGEADLGAAHSLTWLVKPRDLPYDTLYARLAVHTDQPGSSLWRRMLVLGPTPEFGLLGPEPGAVPQDLQPQRLDLHRLWP